MAKKRKYKPEYAASAGGQDTFGMLFFSMLTSAAFIALPPTAKLVYACCRVQATSKQGRASLYKHKQNEAKDYPDTCFVFPTKHQRAFGFTDRGNFSRAMQALIDAGFIDKIEDNAHRWRTNIYRFSSRWTT